jgi:hypothetical protein
MVRPLLNRYRAEYKARNVAVPKVLQDWDEFYIVLVFSADRPPMVCKGKASSRGARLVAPSFVSARLLSDVPPVERFRMPGNIPVYSVTETQEDPFSAYGPVPPPPAAAAQPACELLF